jgi:hypothetical protein
MQVQMKLASGSAWTGAGGSSWQVTTSPARTACPGFVGTEPLTVTSPSRMEACSLVRLAPGMDADRNASSRVLFCASSTRKLLAASCAARGMLHPDAYLEEEMVSHRLAHSTPLADCMQPF